MASCKDCLSCKVCYDTQVENLPECTEVRDCEHFKDRNRFVELPCKIGEELYRIYTLRDLGYLPYVMIYQKETADKQHRDLQRWCNNRLIFRSCPNFKDYKKR